MPQISPNKAKTNQIFALLITSLIASVFVAIIWKIWQSNSERFYILIAIGTLVCYHVYRSLTAKYRHRNIILNTPFPNKWRTLLIQHVSFYNALSKDKQHQFEQNIQIFLAEKRVTGIKTIRFIRSGFDT